MLASVCAGISAPQPGTGTVGSPIEAPGVSIADSLVDLSALLQLSAPPATVAPGALFDASGVLQVGTDFSARFNNESGLLLAPFTMTFDAPHHSRSIRT